MAKYADFKVLLDQPAESPGVGFDVFASALADVVLGSQAEFAVGIFGTWGSGKTTLMRAIKGILDRDASVVTVWFTAWRYERDPHLIIPLLDVLREALDERSKEQPGWAREAAAGVARAARAILAGLTLSVALPGVGATVDAGKIIDAIQQTDDGAQGLSFYQAGFLMLRETILNLSDGGKRRVVIFVDDLDRCLPINALEVLESMKLFFDVEGCVFVVGLDQDIAERAVLAKYGEYASQKDQGGVSGTDYVKKIFQVPFVLPRISSAQLQDYLSTVQSNAGIGEAQRADFEANVRRHLRFLPNEDSVNPREIKRLINAYILQLKILSARLGERLDPNIVLALQIMSFRADWRELYDHLATEPYLFQSVIREAVQEQEPPTTVWLSGIKVALPPGFLQYVRSDAEALLDASDLQAYVSVAEATRHADPSIREARAMVSRLRRTIDEVLAGTLPEGDASARATSAIRRLSDLIVKIRSTAYPLRGIASQLESVASQLQPSDTKDDSRLAETWGPTVMQLLDKLDGILRELDRQMTIGAYA